MSLDKHYKQPKDVIDYPISFSEWLAERPGYSISTYVVEADPGIDVVTHIRFGDIITPFIGGGTSGQSYKVTVRATMTPSPLVKEFEFMVKVLEK